MVTKSNKTSKKQNEEKKQVSSKSKNKNNKQQGPRFRICSKNEPLQPLNIGIKLKSKKPLKKSQ